MKMNPIHMIINFCTEYFVDP